MIPGARHRVSCLGVALSLLAASACYDTLPPPGAFQEGVDGGGNTIGVEIAVFRASPEMVAANETALITFDVKGATTIDLVAVGGAPLFAGSSTLAGQVRTSSLAATTEFEITGYGELGNATGRITVTVVPSAHASIVTATVAAPVITPGGSSLLEWTTSGATKGQVRRLDGTVAYEIPVAEQASGRFMLRPTSSTVYELAFSGADGQEVVESLLVRVAAEGQALSAREHFDAEVRGTFEARCASCHADPGVRGPDYLGAAGAGGFYEAIIADRRLLARPEDSLLALKSEHAGPDLTPVARASLFTWLLQEAEERRIPRPATPTAPYAPRTLREAMTRAGACLIRADWDASYGADPTGHTTEVAHQVATSRGGQGGGACFACHEVGTGGMFLHMDSGAGFADARRRPSLFKLVTPTYSPEGAFLGLAASDRLRAKGQDDLHPAFELSAERVTALGELTRRLLERQKNFALRCDQEK